MSKRQYRVMMKNRRPVKGIVDGEDTELEYFHDRAEAFLYAVLSKERWGTVEVCRMKNGTAELLRRFFHGKKNFDKQKGD
jgi:hypothetical protein